MHRRLEGKVVLVADFAPALLVGRMQPADVSPTVAYLASDDSRYVTGCALPVDAGNADH